MNATQIRTFQALAEPTRLSIVELLTRYGELSAGDISSKFKSSSSAISQHLKILREAHVVIMKKRAQQRVYELDETKMIELEQWAHIRAQRWNDRLNEMETYIKKMK